MIRLFLLITLIVSLSVGIYANETAEAGLSQAAVDSIASSYTSRLNTYSNQRQLDEYNVLLPEALEFLAAHQRWENYFQMRGLSIQHRIFGGRTQEIIGEIEAMQRKADEVNSDYGRAYGHYMMGFAYGVNDDDRNKTYAALYEGIRLLHPYTDDVPYLQLSTKLYTTLVQGLLNDLSVTPGDTLSQEIENVLNEWQQIVHRIDQVATKPNRGYHRFSLYGHYAAFYNENGEYDKALEYIELMQPFNDNFVAWQQTMRQEMRALAGKERYDEALVIVDTLLTRFQEIGSSHDILNMYLYKAEFNHKAGRFDKAYDAQSHHYDLKDSIQRHEISAQLDDLRTRYEVDRHVEEKARNRTYAVLAAVGFILALIALFIWSLYSRRLARKNRALVERIRKQDELQTQLQECSLARRQGAAAKLHAEGAGDAEEPGAGASPDELFVRILNVIDRDQAYTDPTLNRASLAALVGSNEIYVRRSILQNTGQTVNAYLNGLRMRHARELLANPALTVETVAIDSGFGSRKTFHELFRKEYELTPDEFRRFTKQE